MTRVTLRRLTLGGFGPFRDPVTITFSPGLNHMVAGNERGKSSLVNGLMAVVFGMPQLSDPAGFGRSRFRNWEGVSSFTGELEFEVEATTYRIERDFETNRISFTCEKDGGTLSLAGGVHNPRAIKRNETYEDHLEEILRVSHREDFEAIFCVTQPMPEVHQLGQSVQELLSGGGVGFAPVLEGLADRLQELTRCTGDLGVTSQNMRKDRRLQILEAKIRALEEQIEGSRAAVDALEQLKGEQVEVGERLARDRTRFRDRERTRSSWADWRRARSEYRSRREEQMRVDRALEDVLQIENELVQLESTIAREYPEFCGAPEDVEEALDELVSLRGRIGDAAADLKESTCTLDSLRNRCRELASEMSGHRAWDRISSQPEERTRNMRRLASELLGDWDCFQDARHRLEETEEILGREYGVLRRAPESARVGVASYDQTKRELEGQVELADRRLRSAQARVHEHERESRAFEGRHRDIRELGEEAPAALRARLELLEARDEMRDQLRACEEQLAVPVLWRLAAAFVFGILGGGVAYPLWEGVAAIALLAGVVAASLGYFASPQFHFIFRGRLRRRRGELRSRLIACEDRLSSPVDALGGYSGSSAAELGRLEERLRMRSGEADSLRERARQLPAADELAALRDAAARAGEALEEFSRLTGPLAEAFTDPAAAHSRWRGLEEEAQRLRTQLMDYAEGAFGCCPEEVEESLPLDARDEKWREMAEFFAFIRSEGQPSPAAQLAGVLRGCTDRWWSRLEEEARDYAAASAEREGLKKETAAVREVTGRQQLRLETLQKQEKALVSGLEAVLAGSEGDAERARERHNQWVSQLQSVDGARARLAENLRQFEAGSSDDLRRVKLDADNRALESLRRWRELIDENPGLPEVEAADAADDIGQRLRELDDQICALEGDVRELEGRQEELLRQQSRIEGQDPLNIARAEISLRALRAERDEMSLLAGALARAHRGVQAAIITVQSSSREYLQQLATQQLYALTGSEGRTVTIGDGFQVGVEEEGRPCALEQLSKGARDQLYLALRFAVADLMAPEVRLPFIFDDPFVTWDARRRENLKEILQREADRRQMIVLSHSTDYAGWGAPIKLDAP